MSTNQLLNSNHHITNLSIMVLEHLSVTSMQQDTEVIRVQEYYTGSYILLTKGRVGSIYKRGQTQDTINIHPTSILQNELYLVFVFYFCIFYFLVSLLLIPFIFLFLNVFTFSVTYFGFHNHHLNIYILLNSTHTPCCLASASVIHCT